MKILSGLCEAIAQKPVKCRARKLRGLESLEQRCLLTFSTPYISEFQADNESTFADGDGEFSDWIEIHNPTEEAISLSGWHLTDDADNLDKWTFPSNSMSRIEPGRYLIVFASGQDSEDYVDPEGYMHTDFKLKASGEYLALTDPFESVISDFAPQYPPQRMDTTYGWEGVETFDNVSLIHPDSVTTAWVPADGSLESDGVALWAQPEFDDSGWHLSPSPNAGFYETFVPNPDAITLTDELSDRNIIAQVIEPNLSSLLDRSRIFGPTFDAGSPVTVRTLKELANGYSVTSGSLISRVHQQPYRWTLSGAHELNGPYSVVDFRDAQQFDPGETRRYEFVNDQAYEYYQFEFYNEASTLGSESEQVFVTELEIVSTHLGAEQVLDVNLVDEWYEHQSSVYLRTELEVDAGFQVLRPEIAGIADDGAVLYLNGQMVSSINAPEIAEWNSRALTRRTRNTSLLSIRDSGSFTRSLPSDLFVEGSNVLGIHLLNYEESPTEMLFQTIDVRGTRLSVPDEYGFILQPTPGQANATAREGFAEKPAIIGDSGFFDESFEVEIETPTTGASIYYTTDGQKPDLIRGTFYDGPITIDSTTILRASTFREDLHPSDSATASYFFVNDIVSQSHDDILAMGYDFAQPVGMDRRIIGEFDEEGNSLGGDNYDGIYAATIKDDLQAIPSISLVMEHSEVCALLTTCNYTDPAAPFSPSSHPEGISVELIYPDGTQGFKTNAGIEIQGNTFFSGLSKPSFRLKFKEEFGPTKLEYPLFGTDAVSSFDTLVLRGEHQDGYNSMAGYMRDEFARQSQRDLGHNSPNGTRAHLYINGMYWGLYNPVERPDSEYSADHYGGEKEEWGVMKHGRSFEGDNSGWDEMFSIARAIQTEATADGRELQFQKLLGNNPDGTNNPDFETYLALDQYIDYILLNQFIGNRDWRANANWYASRKNGPDSTGYHFHSWDAERSLDPFFPTSFPATAGNLQVPGPHPLLTHSESYIRRFADRAHRALFNNGALTTQQAINRYRSLSQTIDQAIGGEKARWRSPHPTKADWVAANDAIVGDFLLQRTGIFIEYLRDEGLYPNVDAPVFDQHGGRVEFGQQVTLTAPGGQIYYTGDGTDPRGTDGLPAGRRYFRALPINREVTIKARSFVNGEWSALTEAVFTPSVIGDYDGNGTVDVPDYFVWAQTFNSTTELAADGNENGIVDFGDFTIWRDNFGNSRDSQAPPPGTDEFPSDLTFQTAPTRHRQTHDVTDTELIDLVFVDEEKFAW